MRAFRIGRIFGIELRVDWSWVFIFVLLTWNLVAVFSRWHPDWPPVEGFVLAATASLAFFGCVLLHELAHSVVATSYGLRVRSITLFLFGGVSNIEREPPSPGVEFFTAIVGPVTSIAIGIAFFLVASVITTVPTTDAEATWNAMQRLGPLATLLAWLGPINVTIGFFNLVPGFPLDGGRVLRAALWKATGNLRTATLWASTTGQAIGWLFVAAGIAMSFGARVPFFGSGLGSGLWLAFIGWFLHGAAVQAATRLALDDALAGMTVSELMRREPSFAAPDLSVARLVHDHLVTGDDRALPVVEGGTLVGLVSISDVRGLGPQQWETTPISAIMRRADALLVTSPEEPLSSAFEKLVRENVGQLPVIAEGRFVGMLRRRDVARWLELAWKPGSGTGNRSNPAGPRDVGRSSRDDHPPDHAGSVKHPA